MVFFGGGVDYEALRSMPLPELGRLSREARRIAAKLGV